MLLRKIHPSYLTVGFSCGVVAGAILAVVFRLQFFSPLLWTFVSLLFLVLAFMRPSVLFVMFAIFSGMILAFFRVAAEASGQEILGSLVGKNVEISGVVQGDPDQDGRTYTFKLGELCAREDCFAGTIYVSLYSAHEIMRSDKVTVSGKISSGFGVYGGTMYRAKLVQLLHSDSKDLLLNVRNWFSGKVRENLPEEESRLGLAYLLGMKNGLSDEMAEVLRVVGLSHLVVASGTHLSIIVEFMKKIFCKISRFAGLFFSLLLILGFAGMIGWTASITRAALVTIFSLLAWYVGRKFTAGRLLIFVMAITLMLDPMFIFNVGWLLSFGAYAGITILRPRLVRLLYEKKKPPGVSEIILVTVAATTACAPILLYFFGSISIISLLANLLILPTMPIVMGLTFLTGVTSFWPFLAGLVGKVTGLLLDFHLFVMNFLGQQKVFLITIEKNQPWVFLLYIPIMIFLLVSVAINNDIYISGDDTGQNDWAFDGLDEGVNVGGEVIKREEISKRAGNERGQNSRENDGFNNAEKTKKTATRRFKIKKKRKR